MQYLFYLSFAFVTLTLITKKHYVVNLIYWIVAGSVLVSIFGFLEHVGLNLFMYTVFDKGVASTLGHPSFLGAYLVMIIPLTIALIFFTTSKIKRWAVIILALLQIVVLYFTYTRGAWIAFIGATIFAVILVLIKQKKRKLLYSLIVLLVVSGGLFIGTGLFKTVVDYQTGSGALRVLWAEQATQAIKEKPLTGYGLEMQEDVLIRYYNPLQGVYSSYNVFADRVHNEFMDQALTAGLIGLLVYLAVLIYTFYQAIRYFLLKRNNKESIIILALITGMFAYLVQGMFSFSVTVLSVYFWLYISLIFITIYFGNKNIDSEENGIVKGNRRWNSLFGIVFVVLIGVIIVRPIIADSKLKQMMSIDITDRFAYYETQDLHAGIVPFVENSSGEILYRFRYVDLLIKLASNQNDLEKKENIFSHAEAELNIIKQKNPVSTNYDYKMGELMREWGMIDANKFEIMDQSFRQATIKSPNYASAYFFWGMGLETAGNVPEAKLKYLKAIELFADPNTFGITFDVKRYLTLSIADVYYRLSEVENSLGNTDFADKYYKKNQELIAPYL